MYSRWRKIRGLDKDDPIENKGQMQSSFKQFEKGEGGSKMKIYLSYQDLKTVSYTHLTLPTNTTV